MHWGRKPPCLCEQLVWQDFVVNGYRHFERVVLLLTRILQPNIGSFASHFLSSYLDTSRERERETFGHEFQRVRKSFDLQACKCLIMIEVTSCETHERREMNTLLEVLSVLEA